MAQYGSPLSDEQVAAVIKNADKNNDGKISFEGKYNDNPYKHVTFS